jgi:UDP-glucose 4-epimerase
VLVTGGAGFIGSHMVDLLLESDYDVVVIDNLARGRLTNLDSHRADPRCQVVEMDMLDLPSRPEVLRDVRYVFHFGGLGDIVPSVERPLDYMRANVDGTLAVLEAARQAGVAKLVYAASSSCYGSHPELPTSEQARVDPDYPYALSKYMGELAVLHWGRVYHLPVNSMRIFNAYGPRVGTTGVYGAVFGVFLAQKLSGKPFTVVGDGTQSRDFVYVTDVVRAFLAAAESAATGDVFNVGTGEPQAINRLVELIGGDVVYVPKRPGEPDCTWADVNKIQSVLGWQASVSFESGVRTMVDHIEHWSDAPVWDTESIAHATRTWFEVLAR